MSAEGCLLYCYISMMLKLSLVSYVFYFFPFLFLRGLVIVQSSGIETLVEELCSKLKDLQSKQGEEKNVYTSEGMYCIYQLCNILRWGGCGGVGCFSVAFTGHAILKYF